MNYKDEKWLKNLDFDWCPVEEQARLGELLIMHGSSEPLVFFTTEGYASDKERETLGRGDCMYIHTWKTQRRVVAKHKHRGFVSIPLEYPIKFKELSDGATGTLKNLVLEGKKLPMRVEVANKEASFFYDLRGRREDVPLQELELLRKYEDLFAIGNLLLNGSIQPQTAVVPIYLPTRGVVARGLKNHPRVVWLALLDHYKAFVKSQNVNTDLLMDNTEINMYSQELPFDDVSEYTTVKPDVYVKFDMSPQRKYEKASNIQKKKALQSPREKDAISKPKNSNARKDSDRPLPPLPKDDDVTEDVDNRYEYVCAKENKSAPNTAASSSSPKSRDQTNKSEIASMDDVPEDLSELSVDEVSDCLRLLNLMCIGDNTVL